MILIFLHIMNTARLIWKEHIENRKSGTGNWFLVPYLSKRLGYFKPVPREQGIGNREQIPSSLCGYMIPMCKSRIRSQFPVPLTIIGFILVSCFVYFINM